MNKFLTIILSLVIALTSNSAFGESLETQCKASADYLISKGHLAEANKDHWVVNICVGNSSQHSQARTSPLGDIPFELSDKDRERLNSQRANNYIRAEAAEMRIAQREREDISRARTRIEVRKVEADGLAYCDDTVTIRSSQSNINMEKVINSAVDRGLDRGAKTFIKEWGGTFKDQRQTQNARCRMRTVNSEFPQIQHVSGKIFTGLLQGISEKF